MLTTGAQPYDLTAPVTDYPITLAELKVWLKITGTEEDALLQSIIAGVTLEAEKYTKREFITKSFETYRDVFGDPEESPSPIGCNFFELPIVIRRSKLQDVTSIEYLKDGSFITLDPSEYFIVNKDAFSQIAPIDQWPIPTQRQQAIKIVFNAGYGDADDVPQDIKNALLAHATAVYTNRGDCDNGSSSCSCNFAPSEAMSVYNQYRIIDFRV
jgi:uncharacterized phiE125 gp8 family phage protein